MKEQEKSLEILKVPDQEPLHVHDLPQLYSQPSITVLLSTLDLLAITPPTISLATPKARRRRSSISKPRRRPIHPSGLTAYLTNIISSPLSWLSADAEREQVWDLASKRLTERAGRTAQGDVVQRYRIPLTAGNELNDEKQGGAAGQDHREKEELAALDTVELVLHEPTLISDNLGLKTWGSSLVLASQLPAIKHHLPQFKRGPGVQGEREKSGADTIISRSGPPQQPPEPVRILELGSGTGLLGLAASAIFPTAQITLSDLPAILPNLRRNLEANVNPLSKLRSDHYRPSSPSSSSPCSPPSFSEDQADSDDYDNLHNSLGIQILPLDWSQSAPRSHATPSTASIPSPPPTSNTQLQPNSQNIILVSDPIYSPLHPTWVVNTILTYLRHGGAALCPLNPPVPSLPSSSTRASPSPSPSPSPSSSTTYREPNPNPHPQAHPKSDSRVIIAYPFRRGYEPERAEFERLMVDVAGFEVCSLDDHNDHNGQKGHDAAEPKAQSKPIPKLEGLGAVGEEWGCRIEGAGSNDNDDDDDDDEVFNEEDSGVEKVRWKVWRWKE